MGISAFSLGLAMTAPASAADAENTIMATEICDVFGVAGITISSDDTCLSISGVMEYEFEYERDGDDELSISSELDWELQFAALTATDAGRASATIMLVPDDVSDPDGAVALEEAYVSIGDLTVLTAGAAPTMMPQVGRDQYILSNLSVSRPGGHSIRVESLIAEGFAVGLGLEDLENDGALVGLIEYETREIEAALGGFIYNLYDISETDADAEWTVYGDILYEVDAIEAFLAFVAGHEGTDLVSSLAYDVGEVVLKSAYGLVHEVEDDTLEHAFGVGFEYGPLDFEIAFLTLDFETLGLLSTVVYELNSTMEIELEFEIEDTLTDSDGEGRLTLINALTDAMELETWGGFETASGDPARYSLGAELIYEPGGDFETSLGLEQWTDGATVITVSAAKEF
ncbi:hypothetical protein [Pelagibacterium mangrovi]|uniref:hypothetical protein n=1 Tax=Pelagibacterium mangrovi TaxID=3119828 RepID=UPI002FC87353